MLDVIDQEELGTLTYDALLGQIAQEEREISRHRARQIRLLREVRRRHFIDTSLSHSRLAGVADIAPDTARSLIDTARSIPELSREMESLESGEWTFDRAEALVALRQAGADEATLAEAENRDIPGIRKLRALTRRVTRRDERRAHEERYVRSQLSLDEMVGFIGAQLRGDDWHTVTTALDQRADELPAPPGEYSREQLRADALVSLANDYLNGTNPHAGRGPLLSIFIDADQAAKSECESGLGVTSGSRIGPDILDEMICEGSVEVVVDTNSGRPVAVGSTTRVVPPKLRRYVLNRDKKCTLDGCGSRYRLEVHHIVPRSRGGTHDLENLDTVCWFHHHIAIHARGNQIDGASPRGRRRLIPDRPDPP